MAILLISGSPALRDVLTPELSNAMPRKSLSVIFRNGVKDLAFPMNFYEAKDIATKHLTDVINEIQNDNSPDKEPTIITVIPFFSYVPHDFKTALRMQYLIQSLTLQSNATTRITNVTKTFTVQDMQDHGVVTTIQNAVRPALRAHL